MALSPVFEVVYSTNNSGSKTTQRVTGCHTEEEAKDKVSRSFGSSTSVQIISCRRVD